MNIFEKIHENFKNMHKESIMLSDGAKKIVNQMEGYDEEKEEMNFENMGWNTVDKANIAGGIEENRELTPEEIESFTIALQQFLQGE